jgi:hypothetical protein
LNLELASTDDLIEELIKRHDHLVLATARHESGNKPVIRAYWSEGGFIERCGLCSILQHDLISDPNMEEL